MENYNSFSPRIEILNIRNETDKIIQNKTFDSEEVILEGCKNCKIINCDFSFDKEDKTMLTLNDCVECTVSNCQFHDKNTAGVTLLIIGEDSKKNVIEGCHFFKLTITQEYTKRYKESHHKPDGKPANLNAEPVRIGGSQFSGCLFNTNINNCHFDHLQADAETVSIKSCGNVLENNRHEECKSSFTIRHGGFNKIQNNRFIGSGGIRVFGDGNEITNNNHKNNDGSKFPPLIIANGNAENDPNFGRESEPIDRKGSSHAKYARVKNNVIQGNTYDNCAGTCVIWGRKKKDDQTLTPTKNKFRTNTIIAEDIDTDSIFLKCSDGARISDSQCEGNRLFGRNGKRGDIPQEAIEVLESRPQIEIESIRPPAVRVGGEEGEELAAEAAAAADTVEHSIR
jgi:hypothetical protein